MSPDRAAAVDAARAAARLPHADRSRAVLIGAARYSELPDLPGVTSGVRDLHRLLTDPVIGGLSSSTCQVVRDPTDVGTVAQQLLQAAREAEDTLLVYFAGHGVLDARNDLHLAVRGTSRDQALVPSTALAYAQVRSILLDSRARNRVVILDCCYSGRAIPEMAGTDLAERTLITGSYVLTATDSYRTARAFDGAGYTAFTGTLLDVLASGIPGGPKLLTLDVLYPRLRDALVARGLPEPRRQGTDTVNGLALTRNPAPRLITSVPGRRAARSATSAATSATATRTTPWSRTVSLALVLVLIALLGVWSAGSVTRLRLDQHSRDVAALATEVTSVLAAVDDEQTVTLQRRSAARAATVQKVRVTQARDTTDRTLARLRAAIGAPPDEPWSTAVANALQPISGIAQTLSSVRRRADQDAAWQLTAEGYRRPLDAVVALEHVLAQELAASAGSADVADVGHFVLALVTASDALSQESSALLAALNEGRASGAQTQNLDRLATIQEVAVAQAGSFAPTNQKTMVDDLQAEHVELARSRAGAVGSLTGPGASSASTAGLLRWQTESADYAQLARGHARSLAAAELDALESAGHDASADARTALLQTGLAAALACCAVAVAARRLFVAITPFRSLPPGKILGGT